MKKMMAWFAVLSLFISLFISLFQPLQIKGAGKDIVLEGTCGKHATWKYDKKTKTLTVRGTGMITSGEWEWEDWYDSLNTENQMEKVVIKKGITSIKKGVFSSAKMKKVVLPETLQQIGERAFYGCTELEEIRIPSSVTMIGEEAFSSCMSLKKLIIPEGVTNIGKNAVAGCRSLSLLKLPKSLRTNPVNLGVDSIYTLQKLVNNTRFAVPVKSVRNKITWRANGKVVQETGAGTTGKAARKKYKISYYLQGAKISGKRKTSYRYGDSIEIPGQATKKNGCFFGWQIVKGRYAFLGRYDMEEDEFPAYGNITIEPIFMYCTINKSQNGEVHLTFNGKEVLEPGTGVVLRYYSMKGKNKKIKWKEIFFDDNSRSDLYISNLDKGKKYCFEIQLFDLDSDWEEDIEKTVKEDAYWKCVGKLTLP